MKTDKNDLALLILIYCSAAFLLMAILCYVYFFHLRLNLDATDRFVFTRVFLSGPVLPFLGLIFILVFKNQVHKVFGYLFIASGIIWIAVVVNEVMQEDA